MTQTDLQEAIISTVNQAPDRIPGVVEKVAAAPGIERHEVRAAVELLVDRGDLKLDLDMRLETVRK